MKTAKIETFKEGKQLQFGTVYTITFDNGDTGEAICKTPPSIGEAWNYTAEESQYGLKIKRVTEGFKGGKSYPRESAEEKFVGFAGRWVTDLVIADKIKIEQWEAILRRQVEVMVDIAKKLS